MKTKLLLATAVACFYFATASLAQTVPSYVPTNGLVGWWPFNGNAIDESGNGNNGTVFGATTTNDRYGAVNSCYSFNGTTDRISIGALNQDIGNPNTPATISLWFKTNTTYIPGPYNLDPIGTIISDYNGSAPCCEYDFAAYLTLNDNPNSLNWGQRHSTPFPSDENYGITNNFTNDVWYHVVMILDGTGNKFMYINSSIATYTMYNGQPINDTVGSYVASNNYANPTPPHNPDWQIGASHWNNGANAFDYINYYKGFIDDIGIWNRALTLQEITALYTGQAPCIKPEPISLGTSASTRLCPSESVTIEIVSPADSANYTYQWTRNGTNMIGATTRSITVNDAAKYKVFVSSGPGVDCRRVSGLVETTPSIPPAVTATAPNGTSYCPGDSVLMTATGATAGYSYRWKRFGVVIPSAISNTLYATQTGNYRCEIYNAGGCITQSNLISITNGTSCRIMEQTNSDVSVYPNPAENAFTVSFNDIGNETPVSVSLRSMQGQVIEQRNIAGKEDVQFAVNKLAPGLYVVIIQLESGDSIEKTVVVE